MQPGQKYRVMQKTGQLSIKWKSDTTQMNVTLHADQFFRHQTQ